MDRMKKTFVYILLFVLAVFIICFLLPAQMGRIEVIKILIEDVCVVMIGALITVISILFIIQKAKMGYSLLAAAFGILIAALGFFGCTNAARGLQAGPELVENGSYELDRSSNKGFTSYYMVMTPDSNGMGSVKIQLDKSTYQYLDVNTPDVTVSYYPYVNVANEVVYK